MPKPRLLSRMGHTVLVLELELAVVCAETVEAESVSPAIKRRTAPIREYAMRVWLVFIWSLDVLHRSFLPTLPFIFARRRPPILRV
jgi:hypothetical protein